MLMPFIPTANPFKWAFDQVDPLITSSYGNSLSLRAFHIEKLKVIGKLGPDRLNRGQSIISQCLPNLSHSQNRLLLSSMIYHYALIMTMDHSPIEVFTQWALEGRDKGMENGHAQSVEVMISKALTRIGKPFKSVDVGCGNGWAVRKLSKLSDCASSMGVDGSSAMIDKAKKIDPEGKYQVGRLPGWTPIEKVDLVFSMEFIYYLENPFEFLKSTYDNWLLDGGTIAIGMDHYLEKKQAFHGLIR